MGITAAITSIAGTASAASAARKEKKRADAERKKQEAEMKKQEEEQKRKEEIESAKLAASSPFHGTSAARRIALERRQLSKSSGKGRSGSVIRSTGTLG